MNCGSYTYQSQKKGNKGNNFPNNIAISRQIKK